MKKSKFSESQIIKAIKEIEGGRSVEDLFNDFQTIISKYSDEINEYGMRLILLAYKDKNMACSKWEELTKE
jgi:hypothetical protein